MAKWFKDGIEATESEIRAMHPNTVFGFPFNPVSLGWEVIFDTPQPTITDLQIAYQNGTELDTLGNRAVKWTVINKFATAIEEDAYLVQKQVDAIKNAVIKFETMTTDYIQSKVDAYNTANGLAFKDIDAFAKYAVLPTSVHNTIAIRFITYADNIWGALRTYQAALTAIPTDADVQAILDSVVF